MENTALAVRVRLEEPGMLQKLVERLARREEDESLQEFMSNEWGLTLTSSLEGYALGDLVLSTEQELINSTFDTCFLFTCTKGKESNYRLTWVCSLS